MSNEQIKLDQYDNWLKDDSDVAALVMRQWLVPVEGKDAVIFPPTYAKPERMKEEDWTGYNIDRFDDGTSVCQIDSVGSQANRMEPIFKQEPYNKLVPQVVIKAGDNEINLLDAGHRAADAIVRFSNLKGALESAFEAVIKHGDAEQLAKIAPTSLVFGAWDSRATQVKLPRIVRSVIRAFGVKPLHRSAQYVPPVEYVDKGLLEAPGKGQQDSMSQLGLSHAPAPWTHGGVQVQGDGIRRDATLNLVALRSLGTGSQAKDKTLNLRRYILGLSLVSFTAPQETFLREGCQLVPDAERPAVWHIVRHDGQREAMKISHNDALAYAGAAATSFGVGENRQAHFDPKAANEALGQSRDERRTSRRKNKNTESESEG